MRRLILALVMCLSGQGAAAIEQISPQAFLDIALGKTLVFHDFNYGFYVGTEEFLRRDLSVWKDTSGQCVYGRITIEGEALCFEYDRRPGDKHCWWLFQDSARLIVRTARFTNVQNQEVTQIGEGTLDCPEIPAA